MDDFAHTSALWGDASVVRYMGGKPLSVEECWARFLRYFGHWSLLGFGYWVVEEERQRNLWAKLVLGISSEICNRHWEQSPNSAGFWLRLNMGKDMQQKPPGLR